MSTKDHLSLYKSKSGRHFGKQDHRERLHDEKKQNRNKIRQAAFTAQRNLEPTPNRDNAEAVLPAPPTPSVSTVKVSLKKATEQLPNEKNFTTNLSRQQAFRKRFQKFREKKAQEQNEKKKLKPFVSSVATGRFITNVIAKPLLKKKKVTQPNDQMEVEIKVSKFSPINTRSKNLRLLSPSQLPTPKRKKRKSATDQNEAKSTPKIPTINVKKRIISNVIGKPPEKRNAFVPTNNTVKAIVREPTSSTAATGMIKKLAKPVLIKKRTETVTATEPIKKSPNKSKPTEPIKGATTSKVLEKVGKVSRPVSTLCLAKAAVIPDKFEFQPAASNFIATSTVIKPRISNQPLSNQPLSNNSKKLFNESISPIENGLVKSNLLQEDSPKPLPADEPNLLDVTPVTTDEALPVSPNYVSPFVTITRGKRLSHRKEEIANQSKHSPESRNDLEKRQNKEAAQYFRLQIARESARLMELVDKWVAYKDANAETVPSEYVDQIDVTVGQTRLLTTNKFQQFCLLIDKCEACIGLQPVKPEDLEGFWSMIYIQVENCNKRFEHLETLKKHQWQDPELIVSTKKKIRIENGIAKNKPKTNRSNSMLALMLKEARKKYNESKQNGETSNANIGNGLFLMNRRKSQIQLNDSISRKTMTPQKSIWVVEEHNAVDPLNETTGRTPVKSILKTPGSVRKSRNVLVFNKSPQIKLFNKENQIDTDDSFNKIFAITLIDDSEETLVNN